jgi:hypothetical protein
MSSTQLPVTDRTGDLKIPKLFLNSFALALKKWHSEGSRCGSAVKLAKMRK